MYAIIDIGSNTIRLAIYKVENNRATLLLNKKISAGLASYVKNGEMTAVGIDKACDSLAKFQFLLNHFQIEHRYAFATAALRNAANSASAVAEISKRAGIPITVLSGDEEATLDFVGASSVLQTESGLLIDIGGASTELVVYAQKKIQRTYSLPLGSLNTYDQFVTHLLPDRRERKLIKAAVLQSLEKNTDLYGETFASVCGVGGTIRATRKLNNVLFNLPLDTNEIKAPNIKKMIKLLENDEDDDLISGETLDLLLKVVPDRIRTILPGMIIFNVLLKQFQSEIIVVSDAGVREGYLYGRILQTVPAAPEQNEEGENASDG